jgi:hypothetical protein
VQDVDLDWLLDPEKVFSRSEVLAKPSPVPAEPGIYGWYFADPPGTVPVDGTHEHEGLRLLYVGIAPKKPPPGTQSSRTLRHRLREHYNLNAEGSTLRLTLGCLLGIQLRRIASKKNPGTAKRLTFGQQGEKQLSAWMDDHAFVVWKTTDNAWDQEHELLAHLDLPLNLDANSHGGFHAALSELRAQSRNAARHLPPIDS